MEIKIKGYKCERCGGEWAPRRKNTPIVCPKCKSAYWNIQRESDKKEAKENGRCRTE